MGYNKLLNQIFFKWERMYLSEEGYLYYNNIIYMEFFGRKSFWYKEDDQMKTNIYRV